jgi:hypothetical protein
MDVGIEEDIVRWKDRRSLDIMANIQRIKGKPGDQYEVLFVDKHGHLVVAITEWYRLRTKQGSTSTRDTYLTCLLPFFAFSTRALDRKSRLSWIVPEVHFVAST